MSETIEVGGRVWTLGDAEDVVAWSDGGGLGNAPPSLSCVPGLFRVGFYGDGPYKDLTREHVEALRDFCLPWTEARARELVLGDVVRMGVYEWTVIPNVSNGTHRRLIRPGEHTTIPSHYSVLVRRPRRPKLTLADLEPGERFRFATPGDGPGRGPYTRTVEGCVDSDWETWSEHNYLGGCLVERGE